MALLDFLKNKEEKEKAKKTTVKKTPKASVTEKPVKKEEVVVNPTSPKASKGKGFSFTVIRQPHISEKATNLTSDNKYTFKVYANANKPEIKKSSRRNLRCFSSGL
jgi:hypothetical protein